MTAAPEKLQLTLWKKPDGQMFVGDQHGREVEGVANMSMECSINTGNMLKLECVGYGVRELQAVHAVANATAPALKVKVSEKDVDLIKLKKDPFQRVVVLKWPDDQSPMTVEDLEGFQKSLRTQLGENTTLVNLPEGAELDIIELANPPSVKSELPEGAPTRNKAAWNF